MLTVCFTDQPFRLKIPLQEPPAWYPWMCESPAEACYSEGVWEKGWRRRGSDHFHHQQAGLLFLCRPLRESRWVGVTLDGVLLHSCAYLLGHSIGLVNSLELTNSSMWLKPLVTREHYSICAVGIGCPWGYCGSLVFKIYQSRESHYQGPMATPRNCCSPKNDNIYWKLATPGSFFWHMAFVST